MSANELFKLDDYLYKNNIMGRKLTTTEFIEKSKEIHGDKYDYSLVDYIDNKTKVKIICPIHGLLEQRPNSHLSGYGCVKCGSLTRVKKQTMSISDFTYKSNKIHNNT